MRKDIEKYTRSCHRCQVGRAYRKITSPPLQLMPIPDSPSESISLVFVTNLPKSKWYDSILVVACYLSKMAQFIPTQTVADAVKVNIFKLHGHPKIIISYCDPKFTSKFWKSLFKTLETELWFSTAFHVETDGQTERLNHTLEIVLNHVEDHLNTWTSQFSNLPTTLQDTLLLAIHHSHWFMEQTLIHRYQLPLVALNHKALLRPFWNFFTCLGWRKLVLVLCTGTKTQVSEWIPEVSWLQPWRLSSSSTKPYEKESKALTMLHRTFSSGIETFSRDLPTQVGCTQSCMLDGCDPTILLMLWLVHMIRRMTLQTIVTSPNTNFLTRFWRRKLGGNVLGT